MAKRGLASADLSTRRRVASMGGRASHGGGRSRNMTFSQVGKSTRHNKGMGMKDR